MNLPNKLTLFRLLLVPVFMAFLLLNTFWAYPFALAVFVLASLTDWLDGYLARKYQQITVFGEFMDPLADKLLISAALICFVEIPQLRISAWMVVLIIGREFLITGLRLIAISKGVVIAADRSGKFKTTSQMVTISVCLLVLCAEAILNQFYFFNLFDPSGTSIWQRLSQHLPFWMMLGTTLLTLLSGYSYLHKNSHIFSKETGLS